MSQTNHKYERLEALLSQAMPAAPDPRESRPDRELQQLKAQVAELEGRLAESQETGKSPEPPATTGVSSAETFPESRPDSAPAHAATPGASSNRPATPILSRLFGQFKIQTRLTALILLVTVPLLVGATSIISSQARSKIEASANDGLQKNNEIMSTNLATWLNLNLNTLQEMASLPDIVGMDAARQRPVLQAVANAHPYMYLVSTTDLTGLNVARNDDAKLTDYSDRAWFKGAKAGVPFTFQSLIGKTSKKPALVVSVPIRNDQGQIVGVGMFAADLADLSEQTRVRTIGKTGYVYVIDADNKVLAHPDPAFTTEELRDLSAYPPVAALRQGKTGLITFTDENGIRWRAYVEVLDNGWGVITQQQEGEILAQVSQFNQVTLIIIAIGAIVMLALSWFAIRRTLQPISKLTRSVSAIAAGDLNSRVEVAGTDEIGVLASTFNTMTAQLRNLIGSLESRVADRTHDLELASEVGRSATEKVSDLKELLTSAAEMIRARFDLYYTQVYLVDAAGRALTLRAGTGKTGEELLNRGHNLAINSSSLNGRAVLEKRPIIVEDTLRSSNFKPNPLLPETRSEMVVPLIVGDRVIGALDMQSNRPGTLNETNLPAFEALAGQLAISIQNAQLFAETAKARAEVESQARLLTRSGWADYMDAIHKPQRTGFVFDQNQITPLEKSGLSAASDPRTLSAPIEIAGETVGSFNVELEPGRWTEETRELMQGVAHQVAQRVENLRLLETAERYRSEAETITRRLTREGWTEYSESLGAESLGFVYDLDRVVPLKEHRHDPTDGALTVPLSIRDQAIGQLTVAPSGSAEEAREIMQTVATQLSTHIENLRLSEQNERRAAELEQAVNRLRELDRLKSSFLANMSHELRTPLNSILGFADVMLEQLDGPLTEPMNNDLQLIQKNGQHLLHLINDVLDMAKIEAGRMNFNPEKFRVHEILEEVTSITSTLAGERNISLLIEKDSDRGVEITADRTRIRQVMINLVNNSIKFTEKGGVSMQVTSVNEHVVIKVRDTGIGIPQTKLEEVFQEFAQVDSSTTRKAGGTGLGLPISRRLVELHGGRLWAESAGIPGEGSTFFVELPLESKIAEPIEMQER